MKSSHVLAACAVIVAATNAEAQTPRPIVRKIATISQEWISGIVETRNGRFIIYASGDSIHIRDRRTGATQSAFGRATDAIVNSLTSSASGDRIAFVSAEDENKPPYVWTLAIDTLNGRPIGQARRVGVMPATDPSLSPDGRRIAFAERDPNASGVAGRAVKLYTIPSGGGDATLVTDVSGRGVIRVPRWSADGAFIYFQLYPPGPSLSRGPTLWRVAANGGRPDSLGRLNLFTDASPDGRYLAMFPQGTNWQGIRRPQFVVTTPELRTLGGLDLPGNTRPYAWSLTGQPRVLAVQGDYPSTVKMLSLSTGTESAVPDANRYLRKGRYSPDGSRYGYTALINDKSQLVLRDAHGGSARTLVTTQEVGGAWRWSPDGQWISFIAGDGWLHIVNVARGSEQRLVNLNPNRNYRWRSDSRALHYVSPVPNASGAPAEIRVVTTDGGDSRLTATPGMLVAGDWVSLLDDTTFLVRHAENGTRRLYAVSVTTGAQRVIYTGQVSRASSPIILSPDRKFVAFSVAVPNAGGEQVGIAALDGSSSRVVGPPFECGAGPAAWHPDSKHLLAWTYPSCRSEGYGEYLYLLSLNGDAPKQLTKQSGGNGESSYSLSPDGRTVLYETEVGPGTRSIVEIDFTGALTGRTGGAPNR